MTDLPFLSYLELKQCVYIYIVFIGDGEEYWQCQEREVGVIVKYLAQVSLLEAIVG